MDLTKLAHQAAKRNPLQIYPPFQGTWMVVRWAARCHEMWCGVFLCSGSKIWRSATPRSVFFTGPCGGPSPQQVLTRFWTMFKSCGITRHRPRVLQSIMGQWKLLQPLEVSKDCFIFLWWATTIKFMSSVAKFYGGKLVLFRRHIQKNFKWKALEKRKRGLWHFYSMW